VVLRERRPSVLRERVRRVVRADIRAALRVASDIASLSEALFVAEGWVF
jgi:hypothetical protein